MKVIFTALICVLFSGAFAQNTNIKYVDELDSFDELIKEFKGQTVYIDFWASWCSPCIKELEHDSTLDAFFQNNKITRLYLALEKNTLSEADKEASKMRWIGLVEKYQLNGYNYYAEVKTDFFTDISKQIFKGKLSLPRFAIINQKGQIVEKNAKHPSNPDGLIRQLQGYL